MHRRTVMRTWAWLMLLGSSTAFADDTAIHVHGIGEQHSEPLLHLDATILDRTNAEGGIVDRRSALLDLGSHVRVAAEGTWWQSGLSPSMLETDLAIHGWRAGAEISYELGPFRIGVNASMTRVGNDSHSMAGLFVYRRLRLSHWMHAWIVLGAAVERSHSAGDPDTKQGTTVGLTLGTTFR